MVEFLPAGWPPAYRVKYEIGDPGVDPKERALGPQIRFTVTDQHGMVSFVGPAHAIKMLVAGCSQNPNTLSELLDLTQPLDDAFIRDVRLGLAIFDEHNLRSDTAAFDRQARDAQPVALPPFRVYNDTMRNLASMPVQAGLIIFNLAARRIVQVQNSYGEIKRTDRGRLRRSGRPTRRLYHYRLSQDWSLVP